ncbi:MAG: AAA family ATPase [Candidatus Methanomethylophilaceae archaeon]|nr:AAA family ATPase [Candidatus Methanomethylophilaceae archaeon]
MDPESLSRLLTDSARSVCAYIEDMQFATDPPMGVSVTEVSSYDVKDGYAVLHLQSLVQDTGSLMLQVDSALLSGEEAGFTRYDEVSRTIVARPGASVLSAMAIAHPRVRVLSDVKFLVRSVAEFLERHSRSIGIPCRPVPTGEPEFPEGAEPSEQQREAVRTILSSPMSYVWGAPGTGKTQFVLATCIRTCIAAGMKVAVFAPTNNSVEQVLRGILKAFDEGKLGKGVLRLGVPTKAFLLEHPEMCEDSQAQKRAERLRKSIENMEEILFERTCERMRDSIDSLSKRLEVMEGTASISLAPEMEREMAPILILCSRTRSIDLDEDRDLREVLAEARSALYDRDRPALDIEEYRSMSDADVARMISSLEDELESISSRCTNRRVKDASVIAGTPLQFVSRFRPRGSSDDGRMELDADRIFLDEAGYCTLMHAIALFSNGVPVAFLGDHMQLPPVCEMDREMLERWARGGTGMRDAFLWDMNALGCESLITGNRDDLASCYESGEPPGLSLTARCDLTESHRFGQNLARILDSYVYRNGMTGCGEGDLRIFCIDAVCEERRERENAAERDAVVAFLEAESPDPATIAILTPYADQVRMLKRAVGRYRECVSTVHASQGREWDTVVLSVADNGVLSREVPFRFTSSSSEMGLKIINTAVSRAKRRLVLVCDRSFWISREDELIGKIAEEAEAWSAPDGRGKSDIPGSR